MRIEQALYGEVQGRGHGLRASSTKARIAAEIAPKLDLPDTIPAGLLAWSPFVRGFAIGDHYVLARTFLDAGASRGGMVLSHALIARLADICDLERLAPLFDRLASSLAECHLSVSTLELNVINGKRPPTPDLTGTANALADQGAAPVVRLGIDGFEQLVDSLWQNLWPALRRTFAFRLSFGPSDLVEQPQPMLVCTPEQLQARWTKHRIVNPDDQAPTSEAAGVISGQRDATPILTLAADLSLEIQSLKELTRLERLHHLLNSGGGFDDLLAAVRLVDGLSNDPTIGTCKKDQVIKRFIAEIPRATCRQLLLMRNLALAGFVHTQPLWTAVEDLVSNMIYAPGNDSDLVELILTTMDQHLALQPWRAAVTAGLVASARREESALFRAVWRWVERRPAVFAAVIGILPAEPCIELRLADEAPTKLQGPAPDSLLAPLLTKQWLIAHGAVLAATQPPLEAVRLQLLVDKDVANTTGLRSALRYANPAQILECTIALRNPRLVSLCVDVTLDHPQILAGIRGIDAIEQHVWGAAMGRCRSLWNAPSNAIGARDTVLAQLASGHPVDMGLLEALAETPLADLSVVPDRARLWALLPTSLRDAYLKSTATGWLHAAAQAAPLTIPEPELEAAILTSASFPSTLQTQSVEVEARLAIIATLPSFGEDRFVAWLDNLLRSVHFLPPSVSDQLGSLIANRRYERAAKHLADRYAAHRHDMLPGLRICAHMLSIFIRWKLGISKPSVTEKWIAFEEEVRDLYPNGPDTNELWSRAGGNNSELPPSSHNGVTRWHSTLNSIRQGGHPTPRDLLAVMLKDFPASEKLRLYASDPDVVGQH